MKFFISQFYKTFIWTSVILILCLLPKSSEPTEFWLFKLPHFDKIVHIGLYSILGFIMMFDTNKRIKYAFYICIGYSIFLGETIELIQPLVGRTNELTDLCANVIGCLLGILLNIYLLPKIIKNKNGHTI